MEEQKYVKYQPRYQKKRRRRSGILPAFAAGVLLTLLCAGMIHLLHTVKKTNSAIAFSQTEDLTAETASATITAATKGDEHTSSKPGKSEVPEVVADFAEKNNLMLSEYPEQMLELLRKNPETEEFVLYYPLEHLKEHHADISQVPATNHVPLLMQWDRQWGYIEYAGEPAGLSGCGPLCLSMVGYYLTKDSFTFRPDKILQFAEENGYSVSGSGSKWTLIGEGAVQLGLDVTEIPLDQERIESNLKVGNPIICVMGPGDFTTTGHFIVLTGIEDGKYTVNDPNSHANSERLWSYREIQNQIDNLWVLRYFN